MVMIAEERAAHDALLRWCRSREGQRAAGGNPCLREPRLGCCRVVDVASSYGLFVEASDWRGVLSALRARGFVIAD